MTMQFYRPHSVYQRAREFVEQKDLTQLPFFILRKQSQCTSYVSRAHLRFSKCFLVLWKLLLFRYVVMWVLLSFFSVVFDRSRVRARQHQGSRLSQVSPILFSFEERGLPQPVYKTKSLLESDNKTTSCRYKKIYMNLTLTLWWWDSKYSLIRTSFLRKKQNRFFYCGLLIGDLWGG